jgi:Fe-S cluster assembly protein SufD
MSGTTVDQAPGRRGSGARERFLSAFPAFEERANRTAPVWLRHLRRAAIERFEATGLPTTRDEDWRYTSLAPLEAAPWRLGLDAPPDGVTSDLVATLAVGAPSWSRLVFVNGRHVSALSRIGPLPAGARLGSLADAILVDGDLVEAHLAGPARATDPVRAASPIARDGGFAALNTAFWLDGGFLYLPADAVLQQPLELLFVSAAEAVASHPRNLLLLERGSRASVVASYVTVGSAGSLTNVTTEALVGAGATLEQYTVQRESARAFHVGRMEVRQERESALSSFTTTFGGRLTRNDVHAVLGGAGATASLHGLHVIGGRQHVDVHTVVDHASPHGRSRQLYKGVLDGSARAVFNGRVVVRPGAQKTDAHQTNKNLLLSDTVEVDSKPQLEIFADDVKCSHGAADGQLAADAIFYLRSRGLSEAAARALLAYGFAAEVIGRIPLAAVRTQLERLLAERLQGGRVREDLA